jgi:dynein heavy chain
MTIQILDGDHLLDKRELDFFLKGNTSLDEVDTPPPATWISISGWKDIQTLVNINEVFKNFINDL